ncbi:hypothetical protein [Henriciella litoralis]|uniref:hypothetical protein n=1 Tax=Henriciella litoralis TaxID=568102 RepID=UPI000A044B44|nr:hypothetical protein [Henriciella litoralis]
MDRFADIVRRGLDALKGAADELACRAGFDTGYQLSPGRYRRMKARLALLESILRRLLVLMAASLKIEPSRPGPVCADEGACAPDEAPEARHDALHRRRVRPFQLMLEPSQTSLEGLARLGAMPRHEKLPEITPLRHRHAALLAALKSPEKAARRMARYLARMKADREARPAYPPHRQLSGLSRDLASVAAELPYHLNEVLAGWYNSS